MDCLPAACVRLITARLILFRRFQRYMAASPGMTIGGYSDPTENSHERLRTIDASVKTRTRDALSPARRRAASSRLHLIPICQQRRNPLKSAITARAERKPELCIGVVDPGLRRPADLGFRPRNPLEASNGMGELRAHRTMQPAAKSAKSSQLCGDANYSRVHAEGEPPHNGTLSTLQSSILPS